MSISMKTSKKWLNISFALILTMVLVLTGCSSSSETSKETNSNNKSTDNDTNKVKVLKVAMPGNATRLDPAFAASAPDLTVNQTLYNGLVRFKPELLLSMESREIWQNLGKPVMMELFGRLSFEKVCSGILVMGNLKLQT